MKMLNKKGEEMRIEKRWMFLIVLAFFVVFEVFAEVEQGFLSDIYERRNSSRKLVVDITDLVLKRIQVGASVKEVNLFCYSNGFKVIRSEGGNKIACLKKVVRKNREGRALSLGDEIRVFFVLANGVVGSVDADIAALSL